MSKTYKVWAEIEEYDSDTQKYRDLTQEGIAEPVPIGVFDTLEEAVAFAEGLDYLSVRGATQVKNTKKKKRGRKRGSTYSLLGNLLQALQKHKIPWFITNQSDRQITCRVARMQLPVEVRTERIYVHSAKSGELLAKGTKVVRK